jgi:hypothetical protein
MDDDERCAAYQRIVAELGRSRATNVEAFFRATFETWHDYHRSGREELYVGYSPIIGVDGAKILRDVPGAHVLHVVRNPWSAYADTKKRPVPLSLEHYMTGWTLNQYHALLYARLYPGRMHVLRLEDILADPFGVLGGLCASLGLEPADSLRAPSWNGKPLREVYPWGTIRTPTPEANAATARELNPGEREAVRERASPYLAPLGYDDFL